MNKKILPQSLSKFETMIKEVDKLTNEETWTLYAYVGLKLKERGLVRTRNIVGERGEFLAIKVYNETSLCLAKPNTGGRKRGQPPF